MKYVIWIFFVAVLLVPVRPVFADDDPLVRVSLYMDYDNSGSVTEHDTPAGANFIVELFAVRDGIWTPLYQAQRSQGIGHTFWRLDDDKAYGFRAVPDYPLPSGYAITCQGVLGPDDDDIRRTDRVYYLPCTVWRLYYMPEIFRGPPVFPYGSPS